MYSSEQVMALARYYAVFLMVKATPWYSPQLKRGSALLVEQWRLAVASFGGDAAATTTAWQACFLPALNILDQPLQDAVESAAARRGQPP